MSREIQLSRIITEKIEQLKINKNVKDFLNEILKFEKSILHLEGRVAYAEQYKRMIEMFAPKEEKQS